METVQTAHIRHMQIVLWKWIVGNQMHEPSALQCATNILVDLTQHLEIKIFLWIFIHRFSYRFILCSWSGKFGFALLKS